MNKEESKEDIELEKISEEEKKDMLNEARRNFINFLGGLFLGKDDNSAEGYEESDFLNDNQKEILKNGEKMNDELLKSFYGQKTKSKNINVSLGIFMENNEYPHIKEKEDQEINRNLKRKITNIKNKGFSLNDLEK